jgi:hydrogenase large subunit
LHGYRTIADIMRALNPFTGAFYLEALQMSRMTREMFCLMEGRHVHPSTLYPGGVGTVPTVQLFTDYIVRLMKYVEFMKKVVPLHDDLFDFFYDALPGTRKWATPDSSRLLGFVQRSRTLRLHLQEHDASGAEDVCHSRRGGRWQAGHHDLVDINLNIRILLGSSYYDDWEHAETFVTHDPLGNPVDQRHPWNQTTTPRPQKRDFTTSTPG